MKLSSLLLIAAIGAVGVGVVGEKVALADVNRNPLVLRVEFGEDVVSGLVGIEAHWNLVDVIGVAGFASSDPVAGVTHGDWLGLGWQNKEAHQPSQSEV